MVDTLTPQQRRKAMQAIRRKDTSIEIKLRKELWSRGIHYRKNSKKVYGHPDIVFIGKKVAVFCDSEFWHGYNWENRKDSIHTNREYWIPKIERNMERDREVNEKLESEGWTVIRFWGKEILKNVSTCADKVIIALKYRNSARANNSPFQFHQTHRVTNLHPRERFFGHIDLGTGRRYFYESWVSTKDLRRTATMQSIVSAS